MQFNNAYDIVVSTGSESAHEMKCRVTVGRFKRMDRKESIGLAERLQDQFADMEKTEKEIRDREEKLAKPLGSFEYEEPPVGIGTSAMRILMAVILVIIWVFFGIYIFTAAIIEDLVTGSGGTYQSIAFYALLIVTVVFIAFTLVLKIRREKKSKDYMKNMKKKDEEYARRRRSDMQNELNYLKERHAAIESDLSAYHELIPEKFRSRYYMSKVKMMLQSEKAQSFDEAIDKLSENHR